MVFINTVSFHRFNLDDARFGFVCGRNDMKTCRLLRFVVRRNEFRMCFDVLQFGTTPVSIQFVCDDFVFLAAQLNDTMFAFQLISQVASIFHNTRNHSHVPNTIKVFLLCCAIFHSVVFYLPRQVAFVFKFRWGFTYFRPRTLRRPPQTRTR